MTTEEKVQTIIAEVCRHMPGARAVDLEKNTPQGAKLREAFSKCARRVAAETGDKEFLSIARAFTVPMSVKPVGGFETK